jgi:hypothetical protein
MELVEHKAAKERNSGGTPRILHTKAVRIYLPDL